MKMSDKENGGGESRVAYTIIRRDIYSYNRRFSTSNNESMDHFARYPYTYLKSRLYIEAAAVLVYSLQNSPVRPNLLSLLYSLLGPLSVILYYSSDIVWKLVALLNFVIFKGILDWSDGALARIIGQTSLKGHILDTWGAHVNSCAFFICIVLHVFQMTNNIYYIFIGMGILFVRGVDLRDWADRASIGGGINGFNNIRTKEIMPSVSLKNGIASKLYKVGTVFNDDRARVVDLISLIIFLELVRGQAFLSIIILFGMSVGTLIRLAGGFYAFFVSD